MPLSALDNEFMKYWAKLSDEEKQSLLKMAKQYVLLKDDLTGTEEFNQQLLQEERASYGTRKNKSFSREEVKELTFIVPKELNEKDIRLFIAGMLYEKAIFSSGQAAEYAAITKREFIEKIGQYGFSIFNYAPSELTRDINNA